MSQNQEFTKERFSTEYVSSGETQCLHCISEKITCNGKTPCQRCQKLELVCSNSKKRKFENISTTNQIPNKKTNFSLETMIQKISQKLTPSIPLNQQESNRNATSQAPEIFNEIYQTFSDSPIPDSIDVKEKNNDTCLHHAFIDDAISHVNVTKSNTNAETSMTKELNEKIKKLQEENLLLKKKQFTQMPNFKQDCGILFLTHRGDVCLWNDIMEKKLGYEENFLSEKKIKLQEILEEKNILPSLMNFTKAIREQSETIECLMKFKSKDGKVLEANATGFMSYICGQPYPFYQIIFVDFL
jgi:PAS domain-containing protein